MSRNLGVGRLLGLMLLGAVGTLPVALFGQDADVDPEGRQCKPRGATTVASTVMDDRRASRSPVNRRGASIIAAGQTHPDLRAGRGLMPNTGKSPLDPRIDSPARKNGLGSRTKADPQETPRHAHSCDA